MKKSYKTKLFQKLIGACLIFSLIGTAAATSGTQSISVLYKDIKLVINGTTVTPKDADGNKVEPFAYKGTTYLPIRAVADALGKTVTWDATSSTVYLADASGDAVTETEYKALCDSYDYSKLLYNYSDYKGTHVYFKGTVIKVAKDGDITGLRINVTPAGGTTTNIIYIYCLTPVDGSGLAEDGSQVAEGDTVEIWGDLAGIKTSSSTTGTSKSIPSILSKYIALAS